MKTWITDRLPTAADADKNGFVYVEIVHGETALWPWNSLLFQYPRLWHRWLQLNDLPPVPEKSPFASWYDGLAGAPAAKSVARQVAEAAWNAAERDLKRQVRELIKDLPHIGEVQQLRELVKEDKQ